MTNVNFTPERHQQFARASGDFNPIHVDPIAARRTQTGEPVVHGIHGLLAVLDVLLGTELRTVRTLRAEFRKPIYVGDAGTVEIIRRTDTDLRTRVVVEGTEVMVATLGFAAGPAHHLSPGVRKDFSRLARPLETPLESLEGTSGRVSLADSMASLAALFPSAAARLDEHRVAALACSSFVVGMLAPGLHSLYRGLNFDLTRETTNALEFAVTSVDTRFRIVRLALEGGGIAGTVDTLSRSPPTPQASMVDLSALVAPGEFSGCCALVVGGSRGLGELTAKMVAAGGGRVLITYARGKEDAERVAAEIRAADGECDVVKFDVQNDSPDKLAEHRPTHLYYFATPFIAKRRRPEEFELYYVTAFKALAEACWRSNPGVRMFYPSSTFIDSRPPDMVEYVHAKVAAEQLCEELERELHVRILRPRLPRLRTDQTAGMMPGQLADPVATMLPWVQQMHSLDSRPSGSN